MKKILSFLTISLVFLYCEISFGQNVNIPDTFFKAALISHIPVIDTNGDGEIQIAEATLFSGHMDVSNDTISDMTGLEAFTNIIGLNCSNNGTVINTINLNSNTELKYLNLYYSRLMITSLDLSDNFKLEYADLENNFYITTIDFSNNPSLTYLRIGRIPLSSPDLSNLTSLDTLICQKCGISSLDLSQNTSLTYLDLFSSQNLTNLNVIGAVNLKKILLHWSGLSSLDVSNLSKLEFLDVDYNNLTSLTLSNNDSLNFIECWNNSLVNLNLSEAPNLANLICGTNLFTSFDFRNHQKLMRVYLKDSPLLTTLDLRNGTNMNTLFLTDFRDCPNLYCISVDDTIFSNTNWIKLDTQTYYSLNCNCPPAVNPKQNDTICQGDSLLIYGFYQNMSGIYYDSLQTINGCDSIFSTTLTVNPVFSSSQIDTVCQGDSLLIYGSYQNTTGTYYDSLQTINGCDSVLSTTLTINPIFSSNQNSSICQGDSLLIYSSYQNTSGIYYDSLQTTLGCDSILSTTLAIDPLPTVNIASFNPDTLCDNGVAVTLPVGTPSGGNYTGTGVGGGNFDPVIAGTGTYDVIYTYTDTNSCINSDTTIIYVQICVGIDEVSNDFGILIYPNPNTGQFTIEKPKGLNKEVKVKLLDATSKLILDKVIPIDQQKVEMDITEYSKGIYYLQLIVGEEVFVKQILKN